MLIFRNAVISTSLAALTLAVSGCGTSSEPSAEETSAAASESTSEPDTAVAEDAAPIALEAPVKAASGDPIRGPGGLEEKCLARVSQETGGRGVGSNRIEESEAAIEIYVNVDGVDEPWKCLGNKDGSISEVMYTGSEGAA